MGGLFDSPDPPPPPKIIKVPEYLPPPEPEPEPVMPDPDDTLLEAANKKSQAMASYTSGRPSTMYTENDDRLG